MDSFLIKAYDRCNIGRTEEERIWLSAFSNHIKKYILRENSYQNGADLTLSILECLTALSNETRIHDDNDDDGHDDNVDDDDDDDDKQSVSALIRYNLISLKSLAKESKICAGQINGDILKRSQLSDLGYNSLTPKVPCFLIGYLKWCPSSLKATPTCGTVFLEDNLSYLPIEASNPDIKWLNQLVVLPSWTYVPTANNCNRGSDSFSCQSLLTSGYIEATSSCVPVFRIHNNLESRPVSLSLSDYQEHESNKKTILNLHGKITAISPVHSMANSKPFFFVQLTCTESSISTSIVVQGSQFMHWVHFLHLEKEYILTEICQTTMNKDTKNERKILACTKSSNFLEYQPESKSAAQRKRKLNEGNVQSRAANISTKRLKRNDNKYNTKVETTDEDNSKSRLTKTGQPLTLSYRGVITKCYPQLEIGTYELDDKVRLYTVHQPCPHYGRGLRAGAEIALYNVHLVKKAKTPLGLCCCTLSTVRVSSFSPLASEWKPSVFTDSPLVLHGQNLSLPDYIDLAQSCGQLIKMFSSMFRRSSLIGYLSSQQQLSSNSNLRQKEPNKHSMIAKLLNAAKTSSSFRKERNIYEEFFDYPHTCSPTCHDSIGLRTISTIVEVREMVIEKSKCMAWKVGSDNACNGSNEWLYQIIQSKDLCPELVVLGCLKGSTTTGYLKIYDQTASIPLIITKTDHISEKSVLDFRDCIVKLNRFTMVVEQFQDSACDSLTGSGKTRVYFQAAIDDLEILMTRQSSLKDDRKQITEKQDLSGIGGNIARSVELSDLENKQLKTTETCVPEGYKNQRSETEYKVDYATTSFGIQGKTIQNQSTSKALCSKVKGNEPMNDNRKTSHDTSITWTVADSTHLTTCKVLFLVRHRENLILKKKKKVFYACAVDIKVLAFSTNEQVKHLDYEEERSNNQASILNGFSEFSLKSKSIALRLQRQNIHWHPFLCEGRFYMLEEKSSSKESSLITKAMNYTSKPLLDVTSSMSIQQVVLPLDAGKERVEAAGSKEYRSEDHVVMAMEGARKRFSCDDDDKVKSVEDILTSNRSEVTEYETKSRKETGIEQVNFRGRIICRELRLSDTAGQLLRGSNVLVPRFGPLEVSTVQQMELGFGYLGNKTMFLRLQDLDSPNTIDIYMDLSRTPCIDGLIPGAIITCRRFLCKLSRGGNIYCSFDACSSLMIEEAATEYLAPAAQRSSRNIPRAYASESSLTHSLMSGVPHRLLIDFISCESSGNRIHTISQVRCRVTAVQKVSMRWQCGKCGHVIIREECSHGCTSSEGFKFSAEARCLVEDGTAEAMLYSSENTLPFLLRLTHDDMSRLKSHALNVGELVYQRYSYVNDRKGDTSQLVSRYTDANRILGDHCCSSAVKRSIKLYCKHVRSSKNKPDMRQTTEKGYDTRSITVNQTEYSTLVLPKLQLKAVDMEDVDYQAEIQRLLFIHASNTTDY